MRFPFQLAAGRRFDCAGFGENAVDHLITAPRYPEFDTKIEYTTHELLAGGQIASALVGLQRLGCATAYAGRFGADAEGEFGLSTLIAESVNMDFAETVAGARSQTAFIIIDARSGERTILWRRDPALRYAADDAPLEIAMLARVLHLDAHDGAANIRLARHARQHGTIVSADIDNLDEHTHALLPLLDVLITSREFPHRLTRLTDERHALRETKSRYGCPVVGMTRGACGALLLIEDTFTESPALPVPGGVRDTTGAGDAFHAGFIYGLLAEAEVEMSLRYGAAVAALKCRRLGARAGLPTRNELEEYLQQV
jgi:sugar/nucleoside kinase (ribokinase family)